MQFRNEDFKMRRIRDRNSSTIDTAIEDVGNSRPGSKKMLSHVTAGISERPAKVSRTAQTDGAPFRGFEHLPDDLVLSIVKAVSSTADKPCDIVNTMLTCKRFKDIAAHPLVLANASAEALVVRPCSWSNNAHRFLKHCADAGNTEACYILGMICFYCLRDRSGGASLMAKAALASHAAALHSLAVIQFNGSGGTRKDKDLKAGVAFCARAAALGHVDAMRELGHCIQDGYGITKNIVEGRRLLLTANAREAAIAVVSSPHEKSSEPAVKASKNCSGFQSLRQHLCHDHAFHKSSATFHSNMEQGGIIITPRSQNRHHFYEIFQSGVCSLLSDYGCSVTSSKLHIVHKFLAEWFRLYRPPAGLRSCSHGECGRPETRRHEFRRCAACGTVNYCSRACQALDWKIRHSHECKPTENWENIEGNDIGNDLELAINEQL